MRLPPRPGGAAYALPALEFNAGVAPNLQLHVVLPGAYATPGQAFGLGDIELGAKFRFVEESGWRP